MQTTATPFPRHTSVLILAALASSFAANHIAARIAFDHDTGLLLAVLCRAGVTMLALATLVFWRRESLQLSPATWRWQVLLGLLIAVQSICIYSAVARIPVGLALLVVNLSPILLALLTWLLGGPRPTRQTLAVMGLILFGLVLVLDVPARLVSSEAPDGQWVAGILFSLTAAAVFAVALWVTDDIAPDGDWLAQVSALGASTTTVRDALAGMTFGSETSGGFDDIEVSAHLTPALTTIRQPRRVIGERAARIVLDLIEEGDASADGEVLPVELIQRSSVTRL